MEQYLLKSTAWNFSLLFWLLQAETNCEIAHILGILPMNSERHTDISCKKKTVCRLSPSSCRYFQELIDCTLLTQNELY